MPLPCDGPQCASSLIASLPHEPHELTPSVRPSCASALRLSLPGALWSSVPLACAIVEQG